MNNRKENTSNNLYSKYKGKMCTLHKLELLSDRQLCTFILLVKEAQHQEVFPPAQVVRGLK